MNIMDNCYYTKNHEWVRVEGNEGWIGVSDYAQDAMGQIVYVELPEVDDSFGQEDAFSVVESVKAASDIYMPVSGTVTEANEALEDEPERINEDPYAHYICKIELEDSTELDNLMKSEEYRSYCESL